MSNVKAYEVNRRAVLAAGNIGCGHLGLSKFAAVMNMMQPMKANSYSEHVTAVHAAAKTAAKDSMCEAAEEVKEFYEREEDVLYNIGISADGTWRRRGYSSSYGVVTGMSLVTGKVLDADYVKGVSGMYGLEWKRRDS